MNYHSFMSLLTGFLQLVAVIIYTLLKLLQIKPAYHSMSSVSWNG
jgi:hypothetical protein